jgi:hypothetical protein
MPVKSCIPIIPSADLEKSLRLWVDGLGFSMSSEMRKDGKLIFCMLQKDNIWFMLNRRAGNPVAPEDYHGIQLYWAPTDIHKTRERLKGLGRCFRTRTSGLWADRVFPYRRRRLFALLRRPDTKIEISRQQNRNRESRNFKPLATVIWMGTHRILCKRPTG